MKFFNHKFNIISWSAWGIGDLTLVDNCENINHGAPALEGIKPMVKRRMPLLSKYIYELSNTQTANDDAKTIPLVYISKNSELNRTFKLIRSFKGDVSPMQFSMSVHNAIAGLLSVIGDDSSIYTVIDSMSGTLETALVEACSLLSENQYVKIIYFDENLPEELSKDFPKHNNPIVLSLLIQKGNNVHLTSKQVGSQRSENHLELIKFLNNQSVSYISSSKRISWEWLNCAKN